MGIMQHQSYILCWHSSSHHYEMHPWISIEGDTLWVLVDSYSLSCLLICLFVLTTYVRL